MFEASIVSQIGIDCTGRSLNLSTSSDSCTFPFQPCCSLLISGGKESVSLYPGNVVY